MYILNLGCGKNYIEGAHNLDKANVDLDLFPWPWADNSVDGVYMIHVLEHLPDHVKVIKECHRILKPGGFLHIIVPHSSAAGGLGCFGHYRTYGYGTFKDYLSTPNYIFPKPLFITHKQELHWRLMRAIGKHSSALMFIVAITNSIINFLAKLSPQIAENIWCYWVGGFQEYEWKGIKI